MPKIKYKSFIIIFFLVFLVQAKVHAFQIIDNQTVDANKMWTLKFTGNVGFDDETKSGIVVTDSRGNFATVTINQGNDPKTILVNAPQEGYVPGEKYTLTINTKAHSSKGKHLKQVRTMHFNIKPNDNKIVTFKDKNLEQVVRDSINKPIGDIYKNDVKNVTSLNASKKGIKDISGIEQLTNLKSINLDSNEITDISPLSSLLSIRTLVLGDYMGSGNNISDLTPLTQLKSLDFLSISNNKVSDIRPLQGLTNLQTLCLHNNKIYNISALQGLANLQSLGLNGNKISDISSLSNLTNLQYIGLGCNQISDISPIKGLINLQELNLGDGFGGNNISDLTPLTQLKKLNFLLIINNKVSDISPLSGLTNLKTLWLSGNPISDYSPVKGYYNNLTDKDFKLTGFTANNIVTFKDKNLEQVIRQQINKPFGDIYKGEVEQITVLDATDKGIQDISGIENLTSLENLKLQNNVYIVDSPKNKIRDISALKGLTNLQFLSLDYNQISNITDLKTLTNLQSLSLDGNQISNITDLKTLTNLQSLSLGDNQISNISILKGLSNLKEIGLYDNQISDITPLNGLINLEYLFLYDNQISDIAPLKGLTKLDVLRLDNNQINNISALKELTNLKSLYLSANQITDYSPVQGYYNNINDKDFKLTDETKPKVMSVSLVDSETILIKFSKNVDHCYAQHTSNYRLLDNKGVDITDHIDKIISYNGDSDTAYYKIKIKKCNPNNTNEDWRLSNSKYTLTIKNIPDTSSNKNIMEPYTITFGGIDDIAPKITGIYAKLRDVSGTDKDKVVVYFSESMDAPTLIQKNNYVFKNGEGDSKALPPDATISVGVDNKSAVIEFPSNYRVLTNCKGTCNGTANEIAAIMVFNVKDTSGNTLDVMSNNNNYTINSDNMTSQNIQ